MTENVRTSANNRKYSRRSPDRQKFHLKRWALTQSIMRWVRGEFIPLSSPFHWYSPILERFEKVLRHQGVKGAILFAKRRRQEYLKYLSVPPGSPEERKYRLKLISAWGQRGAEVVLKKEAPNIRMVLTACTSLRSFRLPVKVDLSTVVDPGISLDLSPMKDTVRLFWGQLCGRFHVPNISQAQWREWHISFKSGPGGTPALLEWADNLSSIPKDLWSHLFRVGGQRFESCIRSLMGGMPSINRIKPSKIGPIRKIVGISDLEGKTRVIGILDYISQSVLRPVHFFLFTILRQIPQDMTFHQGSFVEHVRKWKSETLYSVDLTAATDRFPISVIALVLEGYFPKDWVDSWVKIMVSVPFKVGNSDKEVHYGVGNPMGAYSSWASFALSHHFVMFQACLNTKIRWSKAKYVILGDDVLVGDAVLGEEYIRLILSLGVEVSPAKTFISSEICEFAKRYIYKGEEVTPFPVSAVLDNLEEVSLLVSALDGETKKGYHPKSGVPGCIEKLKKIQGFRRKSCRKWASWAFDSWMGIEYSKGNVEVLDYLRSLNHPPRDDVAEFFFLNGEKVIQYAIARLIQKSFESPMGDFQRDIVNLKESLDSLSDAGHWTSDNYFRHIPTVAVALQAESSLLLLEKGGVFTDPQWSGPLSEVLHEFISNPLNNSSWGMDTRQRKARAMSRLGREIRSLVEDALSDEEGVGTLSLSDRAYPVQRVVWPAVHYVTAPPAAIGVVLKNGRWAVFETPTGPLQMDLYTKLHQLFLRNLQFVDYSGPGVTAQPSLPG